MNKRDGADRGDIKKMRGAMMWFIAAAQYVGVGKPCVVYRLSKKCFKTTVAEISRLAASGITSDVGASITSSLTIMLRRTGRQCMKYALLVTAMCFESTVQLMSFDILQQQPANPSQHTESRYESRHERNCARCEPRCLEIGRASCRERV